MAAKKRDKLLTMDASEITYEMVAKKLREIVTSRGRKGTDKHEQVGTVGVALWPAAAGVISCSSAWSSTVSSTMMSREPVLLTHLKPQYSIAPGYASQEVLHVAV